MRVYIYTCVAAAVLAATLSLSAVPAYAHFGVIIPSDDIVMKGEDREISLDLMFIHPFEGHYMQMDRPRAFGVVAGGKKTDLSGGLRRAGVKGHDTWKAGYGIRRPGDHIFYVEPEPYWEPAEDKFIVHYTKVVVNAFGMEEGWDAPAGMDAEIIPLTRPYGLWTGNVFTGRVMFYGKPAPGAEVEVEYLNTSGKVKPPADPYITQVVKADERGVFTYAMPRAGWWGFAALGEGRKKIKDSAGREHPVEIGGVIWVRTRDMK